MFLQQMSILSEKTFTRELLYVVSNWPTKFRVQQISYCKLLLHSVKKIKCFLRRKSLELFLRYSPLSHFRSVLTHCRFPDFCLSLGKLSLHSGAVYKSWCFYLYQFWRYKARNIHLAVTYIRTHTHMHTHRPISENHFFGLREPQNINQVKTRHRKF